MKDHSGLPFASAEARIQQRIRQKKQPVQTRSRATTEAILEATLQVLVRDGFAKLTTTRVAERAGVSVGTLYQYFPDKRSLVMGLKARYFGLMVEAVAIAMEASANDGLEPLLRRALSALIAVKRDHLDLTRALRGPMAEAEGVSFLRDALQMFVGVLAPRIAGAAPQITNIERMTTLLVAALEGALSHAVNVALEWLEQEWFVDDLVALGVGYVSKVDRRTGTVRDS